jgi:8-oxo-dGTP diphosphatase
MHNKTLCFLLRETPQKEVLLGLKKRGFGVGKYAGFGGGVEADESIEAATVRELEEETGINVAVNDLITAGRVIFRFSAKPHWDQIVHVFIVRTWNGLPAESEEMKPEWHPLANLPFAMMWDDAAHWLPLVLEGKKLHAKFVFAADNETVSQMHIGEWVDNNSGELSSEP